MRLKNNDWQRKERDREREGVVVFYEGGLVRTTPMYLICPRLSDKIYNIAFGNICQPLSETFLEKFENIFNTDRGRGGSFPNSKYKDYRGDTNNAEYV